MNKKYISLVFGLIFTMSAGWASATPITWVFSGGEVIGSFDYDADVGGSAGYSNVDFEVIYYYDFYDSVEASSTSFLLDAFSIEFQDFTSISFSSGLTNLGGIVSFEAFTNCFEDCNSESEEYENPYYFVGSVSSQELPEPGILALFGLGLAGLGLSRRRKA